VIKKGQSKCTIQQFKCLTVASLFKHREFLMLTARLLEKYKADEDQKEFDIELGNLKIFMSTLDVPFNKFYME